MRWISSSLRTVRAVWTLYAVFTAAADDSDHDVKTRSKMKGLAKQLASVQFVNDTDKQTNLHRF